MSSVKLTLQSLSEWVQDVGNAASGAIEVTLESGLLKDFLGDLCGIGGVAGAIFKIGAKVIPDPTPEQRIAARLHRTFLQTLNRELKESEVPISPETWRRYMETELPRVAEKNLAGQFTWLGIFGSRDRKPARNWPLVNELADVGRDWFHGAVLFSGNSPSDDLRRLADRTRGRLVDALAGTVRSLPEDPALRTAFLEAQESVAHEGLSLLADELTTFTRHRLFGEVPQEAVYIEPKLKIVDLRETESSFDWDEIPTTERGDDALFDTIHQAIRRDEARLVVIVGDMGAGKSCLMRVLAAKLAEQYRADRRWAPIYARWRDIYADADLVRAIADRLDAEYGIPLENLETQEQLVYLIDGFDEMSSHQDSVLASYFRRLSRRVDRRCTVIVAMRSSVITESLKLAWKDSKALLVQVQTFDNEDVDAWAEKWRAYSGHEEMTGERLRALCPPTRSDSPMHGQDVIHNPLLLYMLARHVEPVARCREGGLTRTEIFRLFVDQTLRGKLEVSRESFPIAVSEQDYRLLLQEMAWVASWPRHAPRCPVRIMKERVKAQVLKDQLHFEDLRTAFVLHFFHPGLAGEEDFEFQPEGFRHYLLAEWCLRAQFEALADHRSNRLPHSFARTRSEAMRDLAQFPLRGEERELLNGLYEEVGQLAVTPSEALPDRLKHFGMSASDPARAAEAIHDLFERVRDHAEQPPEEAGSLKDEIVGLPEGQDIPPALNGLRLLVNYWDQCLIATFGLYRGLRKTLQGEAIFKQDASALARFLRARHSVQGHSWISDLELRNITFD